MKPVGQRYDVVDGVPADEDAILVRSVFGIQDPLQAMSPVHIPRGFTKAFITGRSSRICRRASGRLPAGRRRRDAMIIEGTGHAGVGAVIGLSNAEVAAMLGAPALIISEGGVGRPIDEIVLNQALFARHGVARGRRGGQQGGRGRATRRCRRSCARAWHSTASSCSAPCRTGRCCPTRRCRCWSSR